MCDNLLCCLSLWKRAIIEIECMERQFTWRSHDKHIERWPPQGANLWNIAVTLALIYFAVKLLYPPPPPNHIKLSKGISFSVFPISQSYVCNLGAISGGKTAVLLDFVQITSPPLPPIWKSSLPVSWDPPSVTKNYHFQSFGNPRE